MVGQAAARRVVIGGSVGGQTAIGRAKVWRGAKRRCNNAALLRSSKGGGGTTFERALPSGVGWTVQHGRGTQRARLRKSKEKWRYKNSGTDPDPTLLFLDEKHLNKNHEKSADKFINKNQI